MHLVYFILSFTLLSILAVMVIIAKRNAQWKDTVIFYIFYKMVYKILIKYYMLYALVI